MPATTGGNPALYFGRQMRKERLAKAWSLRKFAAQSGVNVTTATLIENGHRPPNERVAIACDKVYPHRVGWFLEYFNELQTWTAIPASFRNWEDYESKTATLLIWTPCVVTGAAQTEDYARALVVATGPIDEVTREARVKARMERQARLLTRVNPPKIVLLVDAAALYREVGSPQVMAAQCVRLRELALMPNVTLQVVPEIAHGSLASTYLIADDAVWSENVVTGGVYVAPETLADTRDRFDRLRGESLRVSESLALLEEMEELWSGESPPTQRVTAAIASKPRRRRVP
jgi:transcriptional regulator with XRE-family HTH domain